MNMKVLRCFALNVTSDEQLDSPSYQPTPDASCGFHDGAWNRNKGNIRME
jgi:hypothetical protein